MAPKKTKKRSVLAWPPEAIDRFNALCGPPTHSGCVLWRGSRHTGRWDYGEFRFGSLRSLAHRLSYELSVGPIPAGMELDHLCRTPACVNPRHLEPVSHRENIKRGQRPWQRCPHGDAYRQANNRTCTVCANARRRELYREKHYGV